MARIRGPQDLNQDTPYNRPIFEVDQSKSRIQGPNRGATITNQTPVTPETETANVFPVKRPDLPDPGDTKLSFGEKLSAGLDKVFNMQENNPEAYRKVMSGFDIYLRGQRGDDLITAITGNSKFNAEQASALLQSSLAANNLKLSQMKVLKAEKEAVEVDAPSDDLKKLAGNILDKDFDIDNENIAFQIASRAKVKQRNTPGLDEATALDLAIQDAVASGELTSGKGKLGSGKFKSNVGQAIEIGDDEQDKLDALPTGTKFTYKGKTYVK